MISGGLMRLIGYGAQDTLITSGNYNYSNHNNSNYNTNHNNSNYNTNHNMNNNSNNNN